MEINKDLIKYVESNIMPQYINNNYGGHGWEHIQDVINRSFELMKIFNLDINPNMVYTIAVYHDLGYKQDPDNHEKVSSEMFLQDKKIHKFFNEEEIKTIAEAIVDHRASLEYEARSTYGKLVSSADRAIDVDNMLKRSIAFQYEKHKSENPPVQDIIEYSYKKLSSKYGNGGYAKMYFPDDKYQEYLDKMNKLFSDKSEFVKAEKNIISNNPQLFQKIYVNPILRTYIEENIFPEYDKNEPAHSISHIKYVIDRSFQLVCENNLDVNPNMVYTIAAYHDIGHHIDSKTHEILSAQIMINDESLKQFFTDEERQIIKEAIEDHRASSKEEPRSIYGKIVSSADRNTLVEVPLKRTYSYRLKHNPNDSLDDIIEDSRQHIINKFGKKGYATEKMYFEDLDYKKFLEEISILAEDKNEFKRRFMEVNGLNNKLKLTFDEIKRHNPNMSLEEVIYAVYDTLKDDYNKPFDIFRNMILEANEIDELEYNMLKCMKKSKKI